MISYSYLKGTQRSIGGILAYLDAKHGEEVTGYYEGRAAPSEWLGAGAEELGLSGSVDRAVLAKLLAGHLPNGVDVSQRGNRGGSRRLGCDLTISAPKSVSVLALVCGDERLLAAHDAAVREAARVIERRMMTARLGARGRMIEHTGWMVAAAYRHEDSRPIDGVADPQLHTHVVVANVTKRTDGVWAATDLDFGVRNETLYALDAVYKSALAKRVAELGYAIEKTRDGFEIGSLPAEALAAFSRRTAEIDRALAEGGLDREGATAAQRVRANVSTRLEKEHPGEVMQRYAWRERAREVGLDLEGLRGLRPFEGRPGPEGGSQEQAAAQAATEGAARHLGERASVFSEAELLRDALLSSLGAAGPESVARAIEARCGGLVAGTDRRRGQVFTTGAALAAEQRVLEVVRSGRGAGRAIAEPEAIEQRLAREAREGLALTPGQRAAVHLALETKDRHVGIVGAAGAGKTRALGTIVAIAREAGYEVVGLAPSAVAARALKQAGCERTETLEAGLRQPVAEREDGAHQGRPRLYVLDEAGMVSARDMDRLLQRAEAERARTLLVGDPRQLASVEAGSPFQQMLEAGALRHVRMDKVLRQHDPALREIAQRFARGDAEGAVQAARLYMVEVEKPRLAEAAAAAYLEKTPEERAETLILAGTNRTRSAVNEKIRVGLRERGELGRDELVIRALDKADLTREQARRALSYEPGMVVVFSRAAKDGRHIKAARGSQWEVLGHDNEHVRLRPLAPIGEAAAGQEIVWRPSGEVARAYRAREMALAENERIVFRENDHSRGVTNGMGGMVVGFEHGEAVVRTEAGQELRLSASQAQAIDYGTCRTVHASQGATVERVIVVGEASRVATAQTAYVAASRERLALTILTDDRERLAGAWSRWAERETARQLVAREVARVQAAGEAKGLANEVGRERGLAAARAEQARQQKQEAAREHLPEALTRQRAPRLERREPEHRGPSLGM